MSDMDKNEKTGHDIFARTMVREMKSNNIISSVEDIPDPCAILIIGASGDLTARKVVPALYNLYCSKSLPDPFMITGCARTEMNDDEFRDRMKVAVKGAGNFDQNKWECFSSSLHYRSIFYDDLESFKALADFLRKNDREKGTMGNIISYFAIPPTLYKTTAKMLGQAGLGEQGTDNKGWSRIVVEKPFGRDLETARDLDQSLHEYFSEDQIFRIDHYLAKETVQNILMFRFANSIFEPIWDRRYIEHVRIIAAETLGVEHRAGYYEEAGVLRDMFQNHMMQLLAMTAMEPPSLFEANRIRDEKAKVYRTLRPFPVGRLFDFLVLGQYGRGEIRGKELPAYREEPGVSPVSLTPTFAMMKIYLDNWRWQGVPFYLASGKRLSKKLTEISIQFKEIPHSMFRRTLGERIETNRLTLGIYPDEKITLTFQTKRPGSRVSLRSVTMDFNYRQDYSGPSLDAYEKIFLDCMLGDQILFWRQDGVELCWSFLTPILYSCETCGDRREMLHPYDSGTWGPEEVRRLMTDYY